MDEELNDQEQAAQEQAEYEADMAAMSEAERKAEERAIKNKLKRLLMKVKTRNMLAIVNPEDIKTMSKARKMGIKFKPDLLQIDVAIAMNIQKTVSTAISTAPAWYYIAIAFLIIFVVAAVVVIAASLFSSIFSWFENGDNATGESAFGVTGADFYGVRVAYQNEALASTQMIEDYVTMVVNGAEDIQQTSSTNVGGAQYALQLTLNFELPTEYDYSNFDEASFSASFGVVYNASFEIAKSIYNVDNQADFAGSSLVDCTKGIKYFGYANIDALAETTVQVLVDNTTIQATKDGELVTNSIVLQEIKNKLKEDVASELTGEFSHLEVRTEKLFVKDIILEEDEKVSGITKENYVYYIFMPKRQVNFTSFSFMVGGQDLQNFEIVGSNNGTNYSMEKDSGNLGNETNFGYLYTTGKINATVNTFTNIDANNLEALSEPTSVFEILSNSSLNTDLYLQINIVDDVNVYSLKTGGFTVTISNSVPFIIAEFETLWK